jgi:ribosomal protein L34
VENVRSLPSDCRIVKSPNLKMSEATRFVDGWATSASFRRFSSRIVMKLRLRHSNKKRVRKVGFLRRNKTSKGKRIIARQRKRYGAYRGAFRK